MQKPLSVETFLCKSSSVNRPLCVKALVRKDVLSKSCLFESFSVQKLLHVKGSLCKSLCLQTLLCGKNFSALKRLCATASVCKGVVVQELCCVQKPLFASVGKGFFSVKAFLCKGVGASVRNTSVCRGACM